MTNLNCARHTRLGARLFALLLCYGLSGCGKHHNSDPNGQLAAKVGDYEITRYELNNALAKLPQAPPDQARAESLKVLNELINQQLAVAKAQELKLDRTPQVLAAIEAARREILSRAYFAQVLESVKKPTDKEVDEYYSAHPALFSQRRLYTLKELSLTAQPADSHLVSSLIASNKSIEDLAESLRAHGIRFTASSATRAPESLPLALLPQLLDAKDGSIVSVPTDGGLYVAQIVNTKSAPVDEPTATASIQRYLMAQRNREAAEGEIQHLRETTKVEYLGDFADVKPATDAKPLHLDNTVHAPPGDATSSAKAK